MTNLIRIFSPYTKDVAIMITTRTRKDNTKSHLINQDDFETEPFNRFFFIVFLFDFFNDNLCISLKLRCFYYLIVYAVTNPFL